MAWVLTLLSRLTRSSRLEDQLKSNCGKDCYSSILHLSVQKLVASTLKKTGAFSGTAYTFSGGAIASYIQFGLWNGTAALNGAITKSGTFTGYSGQHKPGPETAQSPVHGRKL